MNEGSEVVHQLNDLINKVLKCWMAIVDFAIDMSFDFEFDDFTPVAEKVVGYEIIPFYSSNFGDLIISNEGSIEERIDHQLKKSFMLITAQIRVRLPKVLHEIFVKHCSSEIFDCNMDYIGCVAVMEFDYLSQYSVMSDLRKAVKGMQLDAFTETTLRSNAVALIEDLMPYLLWFDYAASLAKQMLNSASRTVLIDDMNLVLRYLSLGHELNFAKMTSLCDVA